jgi:Pentapeptide repeats (8 copies)
VDWVSDRPPPRSGHIPVSSFLDSWAGFGFADDAPNAALRLRHADARHDTVIVRLGEPRVRRETHTKRTTRTVRYPARILGRATGNLSYLESDRDRSVGRRFGAASLLIDDASAPVVNGCPIEPYTACPGVNLVGAGLAGADLTGAPLTRAEMADADLNGAELSGAVLNYANLSDADLSDADLSDANLRQANLALATVTGAVLSGATFCNTTMPDGSINNSSCQASGGG